LSLSKEDRAKQRIRARLADLPRHRRALEASRELFPPGFDRDAFLAAFASDDSGELAKANQVQAAFENTHNHLVGLAEGIVALKAWSPDRVDAPTALRKLKEHDVITEAQRRALHDAQVVRSGLQHAYAEANGADLRDAVLAVTEHASAYVEALIAFLIAEGVVRRKPSI
jgi:hypothetical protein